MNEKPKVNKKALDKLDAVRDKLTKQQVKTIRGQILSGNDVGAMKGLQRLLDNEKKENCKHAS